MEAIKTVDLVKRYKRVTAVDKLNLEIQAGELFSLLGVNGAGKTTTIKMLCCLTAPDEGDAHLLGHSIKTDAAAVKQLIAVSPQETAVAPGLSVRENLALMCGVHGFDKVKRNAKIAELTALLGLGGYYAGCKMATKLFHLIPGAGTLLAMGISSLANVIFTYRFALALTRIFKAPKIDLKNLAKTIITVFAGTINAVQNVIDIIDLFLD